MVIVVKESTHIQLTHSDRRPIVSLVCQITRGDMTGTDGTVAISGAGLKVEQATVDLTDNGPLKGTRHREASMV